MFKIGYFDFHFSNEKVPSSKKKKKKKKKKKIHFRVLDSVRQRYLSIILSNFHAFKNIKFMMKFVVGS